MDSKCPIEKLDQTVKKGFQTSAHWLAVIANEKLLTSSYSSWGNTNFKNLLKSRPDQTVKQCADESWLAAFKKAAQCSVEDLRTDEMAHLGIALIFIKLNP